MSYKNLIIHAVSNLPGLLEYASKDMKNDKDVILSSFTIPSYGLVFASNIIKNNKEIVLKAVEKNSDNIKYASNKLKNDK